METIAPFDYGYIFIDRINKKVFFLNNFDAISHFSNFDFEEETYNQLKEQDYKVGITNFSTKTKTHKDVRKEFVMRDFREYKKLFTAIPYIKKISSINEDIKDISSMEAILDELMKLRNKRKVKKERGFSMNNFVNDLIITEFKEWELIEDNKTKNSFIKLFEYLKSENVLSSEDIKGWEKEIDEASDFE